MEKIKVKKEVFDALENLSNRIGKDKLKRELNWLVIKNRLNENEMALSSQVTLTNLVDIAYCGYELEKMPEEIILQEFEWYEKEAFKVDVDVAFLDGIKFALDTYNIKIKGVND